MPEMETLLAEAFGFEDFERVEELQEQIDRTLEKHDSDSALSEDDLAAAAGGIHKTPSKNNSRFPAMKTNRRE